VSEQESCVKQDRQITKEGTSGSYNGVEGTVSSYKRQSKCYAFVSVRVNGVLKFIETVKIVRF
jgi:hypothetical protein